MARTDDSTAADPQTGSPLFRLLPQELRDEIYTHLFASTEFAFSDLPPEHRDHNDQGTTPSLNSLALLRTCRRVHREIGPSWLSAILLKFNSTCRMLDTLAALDSSLLSRIRHLDVFDNMIIATRQDQDQAYHVASALALLPGLRLDTLTVRAVPQALISHEALDGLVREGRGWRELRFVAPGSDILSFARFDPAFGDESERARFWRRPQPAHWRGVMEARDGVKSGASVTIFRSVLPHLTDAVFDPKMRTPFEQDVPEDEEEKAAYGIAADYDLTESGEIYKEVLVVVRRGAGVDYEVRADAPLLEKDIRRGIPERTWGEIRAKYVHTIF